MATPSPDPQAPPPQRPPLLRLFLLATLATPLALLILVIGCVLFTCAVALPLRGIHDLLEGRHLSGIAFLLGGLGSAFAARWYKRKVWETPDSLL